MEELIKKVADSVGITVEQAKGAVETVMNELRDRFPDIGNSIKGFVSGLDKEGDGLDLGDMKDAVTGLFTRKDEGDAIGNG